MMLRCMLLMFHGYLISLVKILGMETKGHEYEINKLLKIMKGRGVGGWFTTTNFDR